MQFPEVKHIYQNNSTLDSTRWKHYASREDDQPVEKVAREGIVIG